MKDEKSVVCGHISPPFEKLGKLKCERLAGHEDNHRMSLSYRWHNSRKSSLDNQD